MEATDKYLTRITAQEFCSITNLVRSQSLQKEILTVIAASPDV